LATLELPHMTPRSKYYADEYHWSRACLTPENIIVLKVATIGRYIYKRVTKEYIREHQRTTHELVIKLALERECRHI